MPKIEGAGDICWRTPRPIQSCRTAAAADDDDNVKMVRSVSIFRIDGWM